MSDPGEFWNSATIQQLRDLWAAGHSTAEIGRRLGCTKNAVVGKAHRLELDNRSSPIIRSTPNPTDTLDQNRMARARRLILAGATRRIVTRETGLTDYNISRAIAKGDLPPLSAQRSAVIAPLPALPSTAAAVALRPVVLAPAMPALVPAVFKPRASSACCWPIGEPGTKTFRFCDEAAVSGKPYCGVHCAVAYVQVRDRREVAA